jgi:hypothetical protein
MRDVIGEATDVIDIHVVTVSNAAADVPSARLVVTGGGWKDY